MWGVPQFHGNKCIDNTGIVGDATPGTQITLGGTANTYTSVVECISAANNTMDSWGITVVGSATGAASASSGCCVDILAGDATEVSLIDSLLVGWAFGGPVRSYFFPLYIPSGTRITARASAERVSFTMNVLVFLHAGPAPWRCGEKVTTYGSKNNNSRGQTVSPAVSGAAASVTQLSASSSKDHFYFLPGFEPYNDTTVADRRHNIGIGVGADTVERIGTWWFGFDSGEKGNGPYPNLGVFRNVPSATRLTMLASNSGTNDATYGGLIYAC
jgi:hypothetical protein